MACLVHRIKLYSEQKERKNRKILYVHWFCRGKDTNWWLESREREKKTAASVDLGHKPVIKQKCPKREEENMTKKIQQTAKQKEHKTMRKKYVTLRSFVWLSVYIAAAVSNTDTLSS